ncbi:MAG TPA: hypothetical protein VGE12_06395 [Noviherbaspirillum sp.]
MPNLSFFLPLVLQSAVVPFGVALALLAALRAGRLNRIASAFAIAGGFLATYFLALHAQWSPMPKVALDWMPWIAAIGVVGALSAERVAREGARLLVRLALSTAVCGAVVWPALAALGMQKAMLVAGIAGLVLGTAWSAMARATARGAMPPLSLAVVAGGAGIALMLDSSQSIGQLCGALASVLGACVVFIFLPRERTAFSPAAAGTSVLLLGALLLNAHVYAGFPLSYLVLLVAGMMAGPVVAGMDKVWRRKGGVGSWATAAVLTVMPVAATVTLAVQAAAAYGGY